MRKIIASIVLVLAAACTTTPPAATGPEWLEGCWIEKGRESWQELKWERDGFAWQGQKVLWIVGGHVVIDQRSKERLEPRDSGWTHCQSDEAGAPISQTCRPAYFGEAAAGTASHRLEIFSSSKRLKIRGFLKGFKEDPYFDGRRIRCEFSSFETSPTIAGFIVRKPLNRRLAFAQSSTNP